jgi:citrate/tricarballylate utilization protein
VEVRLDRVPLNPNDLVIDVWGRTLRNLHGSGRDCTVREEQRTPWRRWFHHCTFSGFLLGLASTSVAAVYHGVLGWVAPYGYTSAPVVLGTVGGLGLLIGPMGLLWQRRLRDPALIDSDQHGLDESFIILLWLTSLTGLLLLILRNGAWRAPLLIVHLGVVLALFVTLPCGKFMHGLYRTAALVKAAVEQDDRRSAGRAPVHLSTGDPRFLPAFRALTSLKQAACNAAHDLRTE